MKKTLSVRSKILLTVVLGVVALSLTVYAISTEVLLKSYLDIEREGMVEDLRRAHDAIQEFGDQQMIKLSDWAAWDDAYFFAETKDPVWAAETIYDTGLANLDINSMIWADSENEIFYTMVVDIIARTEVASSTVVTFFNAHKDLITHESLKESTQGVITLPDGPAIVVSLPLRMSSGEGPSTGSLTFMRYLNANKIEDFAEVTHLAMTVYPYSAARLPEDVLLARAELAKGETHVIEPVSPTRIVGYRTLTGIDGAPELIIRVETERPIYTQGLVTFYLFMGIGALAFLVFGAIILLVLERLVIARFVRLTNDVDKINDDQDLSIRMKGSVRDEIGKLADNINQMLSWLSSSREEAKRLLEEVKLGKEKAEDMVKLRTKELAEEKARLLASINSLSFGFVIASVDGAILLQNPSLARILSLTSAPEHVRDIGKMLADFDLTNFCNDSVGRQVPAEKTDIQLGKKFLRILCAPVFSERATAGQDAQVIGYVLLIEDTTEARVMQRSREEFFSIASHELRTPLTAIHGNTDLLLDTYKDRLPDTEMKSMLEDINASSQRLISIVNDFLQVSRLEQGKIEIKREAFDLGDVIEESVRRLTELANKKGLTLSYVPSELPKVLGDHDRIEQVLDNLIGNAIKFTQKGSVRIETEVAGKKVKVLVIDTGVGISEENQNRLFRKFQQAGEDMLARDVSQSTGLGLYISKLIMSSMGGEVMLERSALGEGSAFSFALPIA